MALLPFERVTEVHVVNINTNAANDATDATDAEKRMVKLLKIRVILIICLAIFPHRFYLIFLISNVSFILIVSTNFTIIDNLVDLDELHIFLSKFG